MTFRLRAACGALFVAACCALGACAHTAQPQPQPSHVQTKAVLLGTVQQGGKAPRFTAVTNRGSFDSARVNKPIFLELFATWCPHCRRETPLIDRLYAQYGKRVAFVAVNASDIGMDRRSPESKADVDAFIRRFHVTYPAGYDADLHAGKLYMDGGFPTLAVIDAHKTIVYLTSGETPYVDLQKAVELALNAR